MEHHNNGKWWGILCGVTGGMSKYYTLQIHLDTAFWQKLFEAGVTAFLCGILGAIGKVLVDRFLSKKHK